MNRMSWERIGAVSGILFVVTIVATFFVPSTPDVDDPAAQIRESLVDDRNGLIAGIYLSGLAAFFFLAFLAALYLRLRRAESEAGPSVLALLGGVATTVMVLAVTGVVLALVAAADEDAGDEALRALLELDGALFIPTGFFFAAFHVGAGLSILGSGVLPRWLGWASVVIALVFLVALFGLFSEDDEGGPLGIVYFLDLLASLLWALATSILMLRRPLERQVATGV
jgi:Domain of unknown function (DUF4386)